MKTKLITVLLIIVTPLLYAQRVLKTELPNISNAKLLCAVTKENASGYFYFSYALVNGVGNTGVIDDFRIDVTRGANTKDIDTVGLRFFNKYDDYMISSNRRAYQKWYGKITPVGFPLLPNRYWVGDLENNYMLAWFSTDTLDVLPGDTLRDFIMMSKGLPGLRNCRIEPLFFSGQYILSEDEDTIKTQVLPRFHSGNIDSVEASLAVNLMVVGPISPPLFFDPIICCDMLTSYTTQSRALGWINNTRDDDCENDENAEDGIVKNLDKRLGKVRDFITSKKFDKAQQQLEKFLNKVEKLWKRNQKEEEKNKKNPKIIFSSEAYALLKYNGEYLSQQIPGKK